MKTAKYSSATFVVMLMACTNSIPGNGPPSTEVDLQQTTVSYTHLTLPTKA